MAESKARLIESVPSSFAKNASVPQARSFAQVVVADVIEQVFTDKFSAAGVLRGREGLTMDKNAKSLLADTVNVHLVEQDVSQTIAASNGMKSSVDCEMSTDRPSDGAAQDVRMVVEQHAAVQEEVSALSAVDEQGNTVHQRVAGERINVVEKKVVVEDALTAGKGPAFGRESLAPAKAPRTEKHSGSHDAFRADKSELAVQRQARPRPQDGAPSSMLNGRQAEQRSSVRDPTVQEQFGIEPVFRPMLSTADSAPRQAAESGERAEEGRVYESGEANQAGRKRKLEETESAKGKDKSETAAMSVPLAEKVKPPSACEAKAVGPAKRARAPNVPSDTLDRSTHHEPVLEQACKAFSGRVDLSAYCGHRIVAYVDGQELAGWVLDVEVPNIEQEAMIEEPKQEVEILGAKDESDEVGYARRRSKKVPVPRKPRRCGPLSAHRPDVTIAPEERNRFLNVIPIASSDVQARSVIVIGAGIAGIAAARALADRGFVVTILEGRGRIGGRIATDWSMGCPVDLGASFIHGADGNPLTEIAREAGLLTYSPRDVDTLLYANGTRVTRDLDKRAEEIWKELLARAGRIAKGPTLDLPSLDIGLGKLLNRLKSELKGGCSEDVDLLLAWHAANLEMACASELPDLSAKHYDMDAGFGFSGSHRLLREGYASMVHALGRNLDIRLDTPVVAVQRDVPVQVQLGEKRSTKKEVGAHGLKTRQGGAAAERSADVLRDRNVRHLGHSRMPWRPSPSAESLITESTRQSAAVRVIAQDGQEFLAESCIVTLPLGVLQSADVEFVPPLPPWKHDAIHNIGFGLVNKVILRFEDPFWINSLPKHPGVDEHLEGGPDYIGRVSAEQGIFYLFLSLQRCIGAPILVAISSGKFAEHIETRSDEEVVGMAMQALTEMFPRKRMSRLLAHTVTRWKSDKFARGSYSFAQVGTTPDDYSHISAALGNLCFAGEATHRNHPATAHGAYMSGIREASRVIEASGIAEADRRRYVRELALLQEPQPSSFQRDAGSAGHGGHYALPAKTRPLSVPSSEERSAAVGTGRARRRMRRSEG